MIGTTQAECLRVGGDLVADSHGSRAIETAVDPETDQHNEAISEPFDRLLKRR